MDKKYVKNKDEEMSKPLSEGIVPSYCDIAPLVKIRYKEASGKISYHNV